ncbi:MULTISPECIES: VOC family protein [Acinetobacter]|uniref:VOC domain-containing protein n=2 Tax=Acinetobacter baylyi TaxID=202950 RepID=Q6FCW0_ACIAD|nr:MULTISPECIES: VOC family protein [Acinetobacter]ENV54746.1 hypothetical protein F952_01432 [Acinetobacter baylyi DSM 14961 = CIP 107474]KAF2370382.1 lactoylglutathione lyase [Acinetobacter baylyi]KAF2373985.1 lactoylglutathione lyase [Acinetobacter baylyi]KAF2377858.1 lactoylglutathione lyase [Acinetobacter baylyi]KAF2379509.1 lactoylglutathione lyase [Acinetobacter baylyi]
MNYDNFFYPAEDLDESKKFYNEVLELPIKFDFSQKGMIAFNVGNEEAAIIIKDKQKFPDIQPSVWIEVENVQTTYEKLLKKNVKFRSKPFKIPTGWVVELYDPSGNIIGITDYNTE